MGHREKHRRINWIPERVAKAEERRKREEARQEADRKRKTEEET